MIAPRETAEARRGVHRAWLEHTCLRGDLRRYDEWFTEDHVLHQTLFPPLPPGPTAAKAMVRFFLQAFSEWTLEIEDQFGDADRVVTRFTASAKHTGPLGAAEPTGKRASIGGIVVSRFAEGRMAETWFEANAWAVLRDLAIGRVVNSVIAAMS